MHFSQIFLDFFFFEKRGWKFLDIFILFFLEIIIIFTLFLHIKHKKIILYDSIFFLFFLFSTNQA